MAQSGAHVTSATSPAGAPSIFEVLAQESLMGAVRPALRHAVKVIGESKPAQFGWLYRYYEEIYTLLDLILQNRFLKKYVQPFLRRRRLNDFLNFGSHSLENYRGSFSENFYGLKRVPFGEENELSSSLTASQRGISVVTLVLFPFIKQRLDKLFEDIESKMATQFSPGQGSSSILYQLYHAVYPYMHTAYEGTLLCYHLAYVFGKTRYHSPLLWLCGVSLQNQSPGDLLDLSTTEPRSRQQGSILKWCRQCLNILAAALSSGLSVGVFFLQFLEWWYSSEVNSASLTSLPVPPPPQKSNISQSSDTICPLCQRSRTNDTAVSVSGYVFCYPCVYRYVDKNGRCPVTGYVCNTDHLVKLYLPNS